MQKQNSGNVLPSIVERVPGKPSRNRRGRRAAEFIRALVGATDWFIKPSDCHLQISTRMPYIWCVKLTGRHEQTVKEGDSLSRGLGAGARGQNVSRPTTALEKRPVTVWHFRRQERFFFHIFFLNEPISGTSTHVCKNMPRKYSKI